MELYNVNDQGVFANGGVPIYADDIGKSEVEMYNIMGSIMSGVFKDFIDIQKNSLANGEVYFTPIILNKFNILLINGQTYDYFNNYHNEIRTDDRYIELPNVVWFNYLDNKFMSLDSNTVNYNDGILWLIEEDTTVIDRLLDDGSNASIKTKDNIKTTIVANGDINNIPTGMALSNFFSIDGFSPSVLNQNSFLYGNVEYIKRSFYQVAGTNTPFIVSNTNKFTTLSHQVYNVSDSTTHISFTLTAVGDLSPSDDDIIKLNSNAMSRRKFSVIGSLGDKIIFSFEFGRYLQHIGGTTISGSEYFINISNSKIT